MILVLVCFLLLTALFPWHQVLDSPVDWDSRIHRLHLYNGVRTYPNEYPAINIKQPDDEAQVMLEL